MSLFSASTTNASTTPTYTAMQLQTSAYGVVVPVVYGTTRVGWNLADYVNFKSFTTPSSSGGKGGVLGGGGKGGGGDSVSYSASVLGIVCEGPVTGINSSWISQTQSAGTPSFQVFDGALAQTAWSYLTTNFPTHALTYSGFAYVAAQDLNLGTSANLPNYNWEVEALLQGTAPGTYGGNGCATGGDADPSQVLKDVLTNAQYGMGFPAAQFGQISSLNESHTIPASGPFTVATTFATSFAFNINVVDAAGNLFTCVGSSPAQGQFTYSAGVYTFNSADHGTSIFIRYVALGPAVNYQNFCGANGLWISPAWTTQSAANSALDDFALGTFSDFVASSGILQIVPRGTVAVTANGYTYAPPNTVLFNLGVDDFMSNENGSVTDDPVVVTRTRQSDQLNSIKIEALDRANQYATVVVEASDQALIDKFGRRAASSKSLHMFCDVGAAQVSAQMQLQDQYIRNQYSFQLDERYGLLDPMDLVTLTEPNYSGLSLVPVRILEITENSDGTLLFNAEEFPGTVGSVPAYNLDVGQGLVQNFNIDPGNSLAPAVFDVPVQLVQSLGLETWLATCSATGNTNWGGCDIYLSTDGTTYVKKGTLTGASRMGALTASFATGSDPDTTHKCSVDLSKSLGVLEAGTQSDADKGVTLCYVDGEYISYEYCNLTSTYHYDVGFDGSTHFYTRRGQWASAIATHAIGSLFVRLDDGVFSIPYSPSDIGRTIWIKLVSFNIFGGGFQDLASVTAYTHTIGGPPTVYAPTTLSTFSALRGILLQWTNPPNFGSWSTEIWRATTNNRASASKIQVVAYPGSSYVDTAVTQGTTYYYWVRTVDISGNVSNFFPAGATSGIPGLPDVATGADIGTGVLTPTNFASTITPVELFASLPSTGNFEGRTVFNTSDGQLYRYHSGAFTTLVPAVSISGTLTAAQIASITAAQITGQITTTQITNNAITTPLINAGAVNTAALAAGAVTAATIASGTITATQMAANSITATQLAANSVTSASVAANAITGGTIAAGAINAGSEIVDNLIVTGHLTANSVTNQAAAASGGLPSVTLTTTGGPVFVSGTANMAANFNPNDVVVLTRDGSGLLNIFIAAAGSGGNQYYSISWVDTPGAGAHTYTFFDSSGGDVVFNGGALSAVELKR